MSSWRKFLLVVLLALSLPIQSFAAVSMPCERVAVAPMEAAPHAMPAAQAGHAGHDSHAPHAPSCSACVSCCFGTGMSGAGAVPAATSVRVAIVAQPLSAVVVSFLTGGIDRPPRRMPA
ncbi:MAG: hypothetical protein LBJ65_34060 [Burkholderia sp.]|jgi:hypothetical protein|uniref:hypothetical protein n=1 Tax=Burkholderia sp. TaxID=36773 RepID=UPI0028302892|nr:hypothetical protein [Burkholderia sp.]MDR0246646.1 hypothetical protein [Burkholderia sp.]